MTSALEYLDTTTKSVINNIVDEYGKDLKKYSSNSQLHSLDIGIAFTQLIMNITDCIILSTGTDSKCYGIKFTKSNPKEFDSVREKTNFYANNGIILQTKVLQIIDFLMRLKDEGVIIFTQTDFGKPINKPTYKCLDPKNFGTMFMTIQSAKINEFIDEIYFSHIVPTISLIGFKNRDYKTIEQERFECSQCTSYIGIITAIIIAIISPISITHCSTSTIDKKQFKTLVDVIQEKNDSINNDSTIENKNTQIINEKNKNEKP